MKVLPVSCCWRIDQCFCVLCFPFHVLDTFWLLTYSWSGSVFCELVSDKNLQSCDFLQRLHKHEIRLEHVFSKSRWTVDVQPDIIGRAYKNKGRLHIPQFHKNGFTLRRASSIDTYRTEWDQTGSFTNIHLQRSCKPFPWRVNNSWKRIQGAGFDILCVFCQVQFDTWKLLSSITSTEWRKNRDRILRDAGISLVFHKIQIFSGMVQRKNGFLKNFGPKGWNK